MIDSSLPSTSGIYLIHFSQRLSHAQHYLGWAKNIKQRVFEHRNSTGAKILAECNRRGIDWKVIRIWPNTSRKDESRMKHNKESTRLCPLCAPERRRKHQLAKKERRIRREMVNLISEKNLPTTEVV